MKKILICIISLSILMQSVTGFCVYADTGDLYTLGTPSEIASVSGYSAVTSEGVTTVTSEGATLYDYGVKYGVTETLPGGHTVLLHIGVVSEKAGMVALSLENSSGTRLGIYEYPTVSQWSDIYMPVSVGSSDVSDAFLKVYTGGSKVQIDTPSITDCGTASISDLVKTSDGKEGIKSGMWMRQSSDWTHTQINYSERFTNGVDSGEDIISDENYLYVLQSTGSKKSLDIIDIKTKELVGSSQNLNQVRQIAFIDENTVFVTCRSESAYIIDVTDRTNPTVLSQYDSVEMATGIDVSGNIAAITNRSFGVELVDISDKTHPVQLSLIRSGEAQSCRIVGNYLYAGVWGEGVVRIYDVTDPANPVSKGEAWLLGEGDGLEVHNGIMYAATGQHSRRFGQPKKNDATDSSPGYGFGNGMEIWDVSDPKNPTRLSVCRTDGKLYINSHDTWDITLGVSDDNHLYAYLNDAYQGVYVYNVDDPENPIRVAHITVRQTVSDGYEAKLSTDGRTIILPYDQTQYGQLPVDGTTIQDGVLYMATSGVGITSYSGSFAKTQIEPERNENLDDNITANSVYSSDFSALNSSFGSETNPVRYYHSGTQIYASLEYNDYVYVAAGLDGITVLKKSDLSVYKKYNTGGITSDIKLYKDSETGTATLYAANGSAGLASYTINSDGTITSTGKTYIHDYTGTKRRSIKQILLSPKANYALVHCGDSVVDLVDMTKSTYSACRTGLYRVTSSGSSNIYIGTSGLMYYRQISPGLINNRYGAAWGYNGYIYLFDFGENDDGPKLIRTDYTNGIKFNSGMDNNLVPYKNTAIALNSNKGYNFVDITDTTRTLTYQSSDVLYGADTGMIGKAICFDNLLFVNQRTTGNCYIVTVKDGKNPFLVSSFSLGSNPDIVYASSDTLYIPGGYEGLYAVPLEKIKSKAEEIENKNLPDTAPDGATVLLQDDFSSSSVNTNVWKHDNYDSSKTSPSATLSDGKIVFKSGNDYQRHSGSYGLFNKKVPLKKLASSDDTYLTLEKNATLTAIYSVDFTNYDETTYARTVFSGLYNSSTIKSASKGSGAYNVSAGFTYYNPSYISSKDGYSGMAKIEYGNYASFSSKTNSPDVWTQSYYDAKSSKIKIEVKITDENGEFLASPKVKMSYRSGISPGWVTNSEAENLALLSTKTESASDYIDSLYFMSNASSLALPVDNVLVYLTQETDEPVPPVEPDDEDGYVRSETLLQDDFSGTYTESSSGTVTTLSKGTTNWVMDKYNSSYTNVKMSIDNERLKFVSGSLQDFRSNKGGHYGMLGKKIPLSADYTDDGSYVKLGKGTSVIAEFKTDLSNLAVSNGSRNVFYGFHNSDFVNNAGYEVKKAPTGVYGIVAGARIFFPKTGNTDTTLYPFADSIGYGYKSDSTKIATNDDVSKTADFKITINLTDENGDFLTSPTYKVSYKPSSSEAWTDSNVRNIEGISTMKYLDCLYFLTEGSGSAIYLDDVDIYTQNLVTYNISCDDSVVTITSPKDITASLLFASYNGDSVLTKTRILENIDIKAGTNKVDVPSDFDMNAEKVKIFLWKDLSDLIPVCSKFEK